MTACCACLTCHDRCMSWLSFIVLIVTVGFIEHTRLSSALVGPDISIALLAYIIIASSEKSLLVRAWMLGLAMDLWNPYTTAWYMFWYLSLAACFIPLRAWVFQKSFIGWFVWAFICHLLMSYLLSGGNDMYADGWRVFFDAVCTGLFAIALGSLCNEIPRLVHPLGGPDVP